jgi:hypothetical protein
VIRYRNIGPLLSARIETSDLERRQQGLKNGRNSRSAREVTSRLGLVSLQLIGEILLRMKQVVLPRPILIPDRGLAIGRTA